MNDFEDLKSDDKERKRDRPKASLAKTLEDHRANLSTPPDILIDNPGKAWIETMNDAELKDYIMKQVAETKTQHELAIAGDPVARKILKIILEQDILIPNILYLRKIGRLPAELADLDPEKDFSLPEPPPGKIK